MKINLSKKEIKAILEWMDIATSFLASHQWAQSPENNKTENKVDMNKLEKKLAKAIGQEGRYDIKIWRSCSGLRKKGEECVNDF